MCCSKSVIRVGLIGVWVLESRKIHGVQSGEDFLSDLRTNLHTKCKCLQADDCVNTVSDAVEAIVLSVRGTLKKRDPFNYFASISNLHLIRWLYKTPPINSHKSFLINGEGNSGHW